MLLSTGRKLDDRIIELFSSKEIWCVQEIAETLESEDAIYSQAAIYKALRGLISSGVVVRSRGRYSLSYIWLMKVRKFAEDCSLLTTADSVQSGPDLDCQKHTWTFSSLYSLNDSFSNLIIMFLSRSESGDVYSWNPHPWFHLIQPEQEMRYVESLKTFNTRMHKLVGGETTLDHQISSLWDPDFTEVCYSDSCWSLKRTEYHVVIDDYLISAKLSNKTAEAIDNFFIQSRSLKQIDITFMRKVFIENRGRLTLSVIQDNKQAERIREKIASNFEL